MFTTVVKRGLTTALLTVIVGVGVLTGPAIASTNANGRHAARPSGGPDDLVPPTIPTTPSLQTLLGTPSGNTRTYTLTAAQFTQKIANFPVKTVQVWGYNGSTPGPTLVAYLGEQVRVILHNTLPVPTTLHFHGMGEPNEDDGVAGISQPIPIPPGGTHVYQFTPKFVGTFAYHSHDDIAVQDARGLEGMFIILPRAEPRDAHANEDFVMTLQQFDPSGEGQLVNPLPQAGVFPFSTINGKTGDASGGPLVIHKGDLVRIRLYNDSDSVHSMHLHGHPFTVVGTNYPIPLSARYQETTITVAPGQFFSIEFRADNPGNWVFHCSFLMHTSNDKLPGWHGAPVGMTRVFHYAGYAPVPPAYFSYQGGA